MNETKLMTGQTFSGIWVEGERHEGPWTFTSDGAGCMYARFVHRNGTVVPWHAVTMANP